MRQHRQQRRTTMSLQQNSTRSFKFWFVHFLRGDDFFLPRRNFTCCHSARRSGTVFVYNTGFLRLIQKFIFLSLKKNSLQRHFAFMRRLFDTPKTHEVTFYTVKMNSALRWINSVMETQYWWRWQIYRSTTTVINTSVLYIMIWWQRPHVKLSGLTVKLLLGCVPISILCQKKMSQCTVCQMQYAKNTRMSCCIRSHFAVC